MKRNPWPYAIVAYFVLFVSGIATWVTFAVRHDDQLVRPDYYEHEMKYQNQMDRIARTAPLRAQIHAAYFSPEKSLRIQLPPDHAACGVTGTIKLYRPSEAALDVDLPLKLDADGGQTACVGGLKRGAWKVQLQWSVGASDFYWEKPLFVEE